MDIFNTEKIYPLAIVGTGPAGLSASIYASRYGVEHVVIGHLPGGQISETHEIDNYPGVEAMGGFVFAQSLVTHAKKYGTPIENKMVTRIVKEDNVFAITIEGGEIVRSRMLLLATGAKRRTLGLDRESELLGHGISYCATCDGFFFRNRVVTVIGGNNSAVGAAVYLSGIAARVRLVYRGTAVRAEECQLKVLREHPNVDIILGTNVVSLVGQDRLEAVVLDTPFEGSEMLPTDGLFIEIGSDPNTDLAHDLGVVIDDGGFIKVGADMSTNMLGVYAAGDITDGSDKFQQVVTAVAEGAIAARNIHAALAKN